MNQVIELLKSHRSIRKFKDEPVTAEQLEQILLEILEDEKELVVFLDYFF